jgi:hypothetical protein
LRFLGSPFGLVVLFGGNAALCNGIRHLLLGHRPRSRPEGRLCQQRLGGTRRHSNSRRAVVHAYLVYPSRRFCTSVARAGRTINRAGIRPLDITVSGPY